MLTIRSLPHGYNKAVSDGSLSRTTMYNDTHSSFLRPTEQPMGQEKVCFVGSQDSNLADAAQMYIGLLSYSMYSTVRTHLLMKSAACSLNSLQRPKSVMS